MDRMQFIQADHNTRRAQKNIASVTVTIEQLKEKQAQAEALGISDICHFGEMLLNAEARLAKYQAILAESSATVAAYKAQKAAAK